MYIQYTNSNRERGRELNQRERERGNTGEYCIDHKAGLKIPT
jgi:hypothetical protein